MFLVLTEREACQKMTEFSVIVPVYNCEDHLRECLDSIVNQYDNNFELLLVNDGSTDNSLSICNEYKQRYDFVKIFSKENEGLLLTRRYSLKLAKNDWIVWVDADDYISDSYFKDVTDRIETNEKIDMVLIKSKTISDEGTFLWDDAPYYMDGKLFCTDTDFYQLFLDLCGDFKINAMWKKITKKSIFDIETNYSSYKKVKGEDLLQSVPLLHRSTCVSYLDKPLYFYRLSKGGLGRNLKAKYVQDFQKVYGTLKEYIDNMYSNDREIQRAFSKHYVEYFTALLKALPINLSIAEFRECVRRVKDDKIIKERNKGVFKSNLDKKTNLLMCFEIYCTDLFYWMAIVGKKLILRIKAE